MDLSTGTCNICTMLRDGEMVVIGNERMRYNMDKVALQVTRWHRNGSLDRGNFGLFCGIFDDRTGLSGWVFVVGRRLKSLILGLYTAGSRLCGIRLKVRFRNESVISAYAPTTDWDEEEKNAFYEPLKRECRRYTGTTC